jgi:hypothetical protein
VKHAFRSLDRILRGDATRLPSLQQGAIDLPVGGLILLIIFLGMIYGACMGLSAVITRWNTPERLMGWEQMGASVVKVPMLFLLTLFITFPSLYVFNALVGSRLAINSMLKLLVAAIGVMLAVLASFGPIIAFFAASTTSYPFMKLLNVLVFVIAGFLGLAFLLQTLHRLTIMQEYVPPVVADAPVSEGDAEPSAEPVRQLPPPLARGALDRLTGRTPSRDTKTIFRIWVIVFSLVGAQMGWVLRPFIGDPDKPFTFFRSRDSNFFQGVAHSVEHLFMADTHRTPSNDAERGRTLP